MLLLKTISVQKKKKNLGAGKTKTSKTGCYGIDFPK